MKLKKRYDLQEFCDELDSANITNTGDYHWMVTLGYVLNREKPAEMRIKF